MRFVILTMLAILSLQIYFDNRPRSCEMFWTDPGYVSQEMKNIKGDIHIDVVIDKNGEPLVFITVCN